MPHPNGVEVTGPDWRPPIGTRIRFCGKHPHAGSLGTVIRHDVYSALGMDAMVVQVDGWPIAAGVLSSKEFQRVEES